MEKLPDKETWGTAYWVGHESCGGGGEREELLIRRRDDIYLVAYVEDPEADYSYDDRAVVKLDKDYYIVSTSGCSCPSPSETWGVDFGPATKKEVIAFLESDDNNSCYGPRSYDPWAGVELLKQLKAKKKNEA